MNKSATSSAVTGSSGNGCGRQEHRPNPRSPRDHGHLALLNTSCSYLRRFTPHVPSSVGFTGGTAATELLVAVDMLHELNATGRRKVSDEAPTGFVPAKWRGYLEHDRGIPAPTGTIGSCAVLLGLREGLRTGDVLVPDLRRYADPAAYLPVRRGQTADEILNSFA